MVGKVAHKKLLGRMMTVVKRQRASLAYLEEVRKHLGRLPSIDPNTRTLVVCGYPNVGKSSFVNKVTRADVEVQPYAFTTKSLYVGHMDYRYLRWQVLDTPGILDHPLDERNTIEMQAITALAHLQCCVLYFIDISEQCGFTISEQCSLFECIKPLFADKPLILILNKVDVVGYESISAENRKLIEKLIEDYELSESNVMTMSNISDEGVSAVKNGACDLLLQTRVGARVLGNKASGILNRLSVTSPNCGSLNKPFIPESVTCMKASGFPPTCSRITEKELMLNAGGAGVYSQDTRKNYLLANDSWKYDAIPEIMDGKNICDFIDPDIAVKLDDLEREQEQLESLHTEGAAMCSSDESDLDDLDSTLLDAVKQKKLLLRQQARGHHGKLPRGAGPEPGLREAVSHLSSLGIETSAFENSSRKRGREIDSSLLADSRRKLLESSKSVKQRKIMKGSKSSDMARLRGERRAQVVSGAKGLLQEKDKNAAKKALKKAQKKIFGKTKRRGEADRKTGPALLKHLIAGKSGLGTSRSR